MSTDPSGAAIGRVDAAVDESSPQAAAASPHSLADLAAAIERVAALIAADATPEPKGSEALERIADIAFVLHERDVEASLCDALDAAVREMSNAEALREASVQRAQEAAELLRELSRRVNDMIALSQAQQRTEPAAAANNAAPSKSESATTVQGDDEKAADDEIPRDGLFATDVREDDEFAQAVAALAASLPSLANSAEPIGDQQREPADSSAQSPDHAQALEPPAQGADDASVPEREAELPQSASAAEVTLVIESASAVFLGEPSLPPALATEQPSIDQSSGRESSIDEITNKLASSDASPPAVPSSFAGEGSEEATSAAVSNEIPSSELPPDVILPNTTAENVSLPAPAARHDNEMALALDAVALAGDDDTAPDQLAPSEPVDAAPQDSRAPADLVIEQPADHDLADRDVEREQQTHLAREAGPQGAVDAAANADEVRRPLGAEPSQVPLPEWQTLVAPDEDPGELFEPIADAPLAAPIEQARSLVAPAPPMPSDLAAPEQTSGPAGESAVEAGQAVPTAMSDLEVKELHEPSAAAGAAPALSAPAGQDAKPPPASVSPLPSPSPRAATGVPPQAVSRTPPNDPLAPVRALSEEEMIALFS